MSAYFALVAAFAVKAVVTLTTATEGQTWN
jgi:hypothetical protein